MIRGWLARRRDAAGAFEAAMESLCVIDMAEYASGVTGETPLWLELNRAVADAEHGVGPLTRWRIVRRVTRELGYFRVVPS